VSIASTESLQKLLSKSGKQVTGVYLILNWRGKIKGVLDIEIDMKFSWGVLDIEMNNEALLGVMRSE
jgi:hypothetical protein